MSKFELSQSFSFEAAHTLNRIVPLVEYAPSMTIHGHSYQATVTVSGDVGASGMLEFFKLPKNKRQQIDLYYLRTKIEGVRSLLDHKFLDDLEGLGAATMENLCLFIYRHIDEFPVCAVTVARPMTGDCCTYRP
jgi:6-pyruvoyltetrahydropterin/6-carboxytetrahydropterin synthase